MNNSPTFNQVANIRQFHSIKEQKTKEPKKWYEICLKSVDFLINLTLFSFSCPAFYFAIEIDANMFTAPVIPRPAQVFTALDNIIENADLDAMACLPSVSFFMSGEGFGITQEQISVVINPNIEVFENRFRKAYSAFFNEFKPTNFIVIK